MRLPDAYPDKVYTAMQNVALLFVSILCLFGFLIFSIHSCIEIFFLPLNMYLYAVITGFF